MLRFVNDYSSIIFAAFFVRSGQIIMNSYVEWGQDLNSSARVSYLWSKTGAIVVTNAHDLGINHTAITPSTRHFRQFGYPLRCLSIT